MLRFYLEGEGMILFFISLILVFLASYFIASAYAKNNSIEGIIYILLSAFAQVVLSVEILSLFKAISVPGILVLNVIMLLGSAYLWKKSAKPLYSISVKGFFNQFLNALKLDKYLIVLFAGWCVFIGVSLFLMAIMPVVNADAGSYHVLRSTFWILNRSLDHFTIADSRNLLLPINSEILYAWVILFTKRLAFFGFFAFSGYILSILSLYGVLRILKFSMRVRLWCIFMLSSFAGVIVQSTGTETDMIVAGLVFSSIYLYWTALKEKRIVPVFFSALAYALALGTKSTAFMAVPGVGLFMIGLGVYYRKKEFYRLFLLFLIFGTLNFLIFSFYNYVLNFINYGNFIGSPAFLQAHSNHQGLRAIPANFTKYLFLFFDFTGFHWGEYFGGKILAVRDAFLSFMNLSDITDGIYNPSNKNLNQSLLEPLMGLGVLGFLVYLPCWLWALIKPIFKHNRQVYFIAAFALLLLINIAVMSYQLQYMIFSIRFLIFFCVVSSPVLVWSYFKRNSLGKFIIVLFAMFYMTLVSTHLWARPFNRIIKYFKAGATISEIRNVASCSNFVPQVEQSPELIKKLPFIDSPCVIRNYFKKYGKDTKILYFPNNAEDLLQTNLLNLAGYHIDFGLMEDIENIDLSKYNMFVVMLNHQYASNVKLYEERKNDVYVNPNSGTVYYRKNEDNPCFYYDNSGMAIADVNNPDIQPCFVRCVFTENYYKKNNLKEIDKLKILKNAIERRDAGPNDQYWIYYVYENQNNKINEEKHAEN